MNNQQAINLLKDLEKSLDDYCELNNEGKTAFGMAITALELFGNSEQLPSIQPDTTTHDSIPAETGGNDEDRTNDDCISRQAAIDALHTILMYRMGTDSNKKRLDDWINSLPPIQPKRGRWHYSDGKPARIGLSFGVVCDQCGTESEYCTNFCGECGADMRGEQ